MSSQAPEDIEPVRGCIGSKEIENCCRRPLRSVEKGNRPLRGPLLFYVDILTRLWFIDVFYLPNQCQWLFGTLCCSSTSQSFFECRECVVIVIAIRQIKRTMLNVALHPIFENLIPNESAAG